MKIVSKRIKLKKNYTLRCQCFLMGSSPTGSLQVESTGTGSCTCHFRHGARKRLEERSSVLHAASRSKTSKADDKLRELIFLAFF
jgi:hypothetical protein